jgi:beta-lactam-binding protein with PASTA domain
MLEEDAERVLVNADYSVGKVYQKGMDAGGGLVYDQDPKPEASSSSKTITLFLEPLRNDSCWRLISGGEACRGNEKTIVPATEVDQTPKPVPHLVRMLEVDAVKLLELHKFKYRIDYSEELNGRRGFVHSQEPEAGAQTDGSEVVILVSAFNEKEPPAENSGKDNSSVPNVVGMTEEKAVGLLRSAGIEKVRLNYTSLDDPAGLVFKQSWEPGSPILGNEQLQLYLGATEDHYKMFRIVGYPQLQLIANFQIIKSTTDSPPESTEPTPDTTVTVTPPEEPLPVTGEKVQTEESDIFVLDLVGRQEGVAKDTFTMMGLKPVIEYKEEGEPGIVLSQSPSKVWVKKGTAVKIIVTSPLDITKTIAVSKVEQPPSTIGPVSTGSSGVIVSPTEDHGARAKVEEFYEAFRQAYELRDETGVMSCMHDDWEALDGTTLFDLEDNLRGIFRMFDEVNVSIGNLNITRAGQETYNVKYRISITGRIYSRNLRHEESSSVEEIVVTAGSRLMIKKTIGGNYWQIN